MAAAAGTSMAEASREAAGILADLRPPRGWRHITARMPQGAATSSMANSPGAAPQQSPMSPQHGGLFFFGEREHRILYGLCSKYRLLSSSMLALIISPAGPFFDSCADVEIAGPSGTVSRTSTQRPGSIGGRWTTSCRKPSRTTVARQRTATRAAGPALQTGAGAGATTTTLVHP